MSSFFRRESDVLAGDMDTGGWRKVSHKRRDSMKEIDSEFAHVNYALICYNGDQPDEGNPKWKEPVVTTVYIDDPKNGISNPLVDDRHYSNASNGSDGHISIPSKLIVSTRKLKVAFILGTFSAVVCGAIAVFWPVILKMLLALELPIRPGSLSFTAWQKYPVPIVTKFYYYNWTNPDEVLKNKVKPHFEELGPYVYYMFREKVDLTFTDYNTVKFRHNNTWIYQPELSNGSLSDIVQTINPLAFAGAYLVKDRTFLRSALDTMMRLYGVQPVIAHTVGEFTFAGYEDPLLDLLNSLHIQLMNVQMDKFAWFAKRNNSAEFEGYYNMDTGAGDLDGICDIIEWNNSTVGPYPSYCGWFNGTTVEMYPPGQPRENISLFLSDVCRTLTLAYKEDINYRGIHGYRFYGAPDLLYNKTTNPDNWCFERDGIEYPNGVTDLSRCQFDAPVLISYPHYLYADPVFLDAVDGISPPTEEEHMTFYDLNPMTGIPFRASGKLQLNYIVSPIPGIRMFDDFPTISAFPMLWYVMEAELPDDLQFLLRLASNIVPIAEATMYAIAVLGTIASAVAAVQFFRQKHRSIRGDHSDIARLVSTGSGDMS